MADGSAAGMELKDRIATLADTVTKAQKQMLDAANARDEKMAHLEDEMETFGSEFGDTRAKVEEIAKAMAGYTGQITKALDAIDSLSAKLDRPDAGGSRRETKGGSIREKAIEHYRVKHFDANAGSEKLVSFDEDSVTDDMVSEYDLGVKAFHKMLRMKPSVQEARVHLSVAEQKAISTISHGNEIWLPTEMSDKLIECWEDETDLGSMFDQITISKSAVSMLVDHDEDPDGTWNCEANCAPTPGTDPVELGLRTFTTGELRIEHCVTHRMLEDSEIDIPGWLATKAARKFQKTRNRAFMNGDGVEKPHGILRDGNHITMLSGNGPTAVPSGQFTWQDLVMMYIKLNNRHKGGASWWFHEDAIAALMTMADGEGRPIFSPQVIQAGGMPSIMGKPIRENTHMPAYLNATTGLPVVGSKPVAFGNWKAGYLVVNRKGFTVLRDPWSKVRCGVVWHFMQRVGGGVQCPDAMMFLTIR